MAVIFLYGSGQLTSYDETISSGLFVPVGRSHFNTPLMADQCQTSLFEYTEV